MESARHVIKHIFDPQGLMDRACHVIIHIWGPHVLNQMASCDVASINHQSHGILSHGRHYPSVPTSHSSGAAGGGGGTGVGLPTTRGLHSSTFQLNVAHCLLGYAG